MTSSTVYALMTSHPYLVHQQQQSLCRYRSKICTNPRAYERDGTLHGYCEEHRQRANANQKKWASPRMQIVDASDVEAFQRTYLQHYQQELAQVNQALLVAHAPDPVATICVNTTAQDTTNDHSDVEVDGDSSQELLDLEGDQLRIALGLDVPFDDDHESTWSF